MKRNIILIMINLLLFGTILKVTNENAILKETDFEIGKTYVDKANRNNKIVLYGDYSAEVIDCIQEECTTFLGSFIIKDNQLIISLDANDLIFNIENVHSFSNAQTLFVLE